MKKAAEKTEEVNHIANLLDVIDRMQISTFAMRGLVDDPTDPGTEESALLALAKTMEADCKIVTDALHGLEDSESSRTRAEDRLQYAVNQLGMSLAELDNAYLAEWQKKRQEVAA